MTIGPTNRQVDKLEVAAGISQAASNVAKQIELARLAQKEALKLEALELERRTRRLQTPSLEEDETSRIQARRLRLPGRSL